MEQDAADRPPTAEKQSRVRRRLRLAGWLVVVVSGVLVVTSVGMFFVVGREDWGAFAGRWASHALGRNVTIGSLRVKPGRWLSIEADAVTLANAKGGSRADMLVVAGITAEVDAWSLIRGPTVVRRLAVDGFDLLLEHVRGGSKNWSFGDDYTGPATPAQQRARFPTILDARVVGTVMVGTSSGAMLRVDLDGMTLKAAGLDEPAHLDGPGAYNGQPITLNALLGSYESFHHTTEPFPTDLTFTSHETVLRFDGTMTDPLNVDGARGRLTLDAPRLDTLFRIGGAKSGPDTSVRLAGAFEHEGARWTMSELVGALVTSKIEGSSWQLLEGGAGEADDVNINLSFDDLNLDPIMGHSTAGDANVSLTVAEHPGTLLALTLAAGHIAYHGVRLNDVKLEGALKKGEISLKTLMAGYLDGTIRASGAIDAADGRGAKAGRVTAELDVAGMDVQGLRALLDMGKLPLTGRVDGRAAVIAEGATLDKAERAARISAVVAMKDGSISRNIVELASTDIRTLFRSAKGMSRVSCLVAVVDMRGGAGTLSPLRIRSAAGTIIGRGTFDLFRKRLNIVIASEGRTTGAFALDVPVRVSGSFGAPSIVPAGLPTGTRAQLTEGDDVGALLPALRGFARESSCLGGAR